MGLNLSKRVEDTLSTSVIFCTVCDSIFDISLSVAQNSSPRLYLYQILPAADRLHIALSPSVPLISRWAPRPPTLSDVDEALIRLETLVGTRLDVGLTRAQFRTFAIQLFRAMILRGAAWGTARALAAGVLGIGGISAAISAPRATVAAAAGVYATGAAVAVYLRLG